MPFSLLRLAAKWPVFVAAATQQQINRQAKMSSGFYPPNLESKLGATFPSFGPKFALRLLALSTEREVFSKVLITQQKIGESFVKRSECLVKNRREGVLIYTLNKTPPLFFTECKLRQSGIKIEATEE